MLEIDGGWGEGGGQIVRTALALSALTRKAFRVTNIRQGRKDSGLKAQHVHCVKALEKLCNAKAQGASIGSSELTFSPSKIKAKTLDVDIGTAGSVSLFLQAVLLPCCFANKPLTIRVTGGTDTKWAMPIDYVQEVLAPQIKRYVGIKITLEKRGYYPKGGGRVSLRIKPKWHVNTKFEDLWKKMQEAGPHVDLREQHNLVHVKGISHASKKLENARVAERQAQAAKNALSQLNCPVSIREEYADTLSAGSGITLWAVFSKNPEDINVENPIILGSDGLGEPGRPAENVGQEAAQKLVQEIRSGAVVDKHLADNLIPWLALFKPGSIKTSEITNHCKTNVFVVQNFLPVKFEVDEKNKIISV